MVFYFKSFKQSGWKLLKSPELKSFTKTLESSSIQTEESLTSRQPHHPDSRVQDTQEQDSRSCSPREHKTSVCVPYITGWESINTPPAPLQIIIFIHQYTMKFYRILFLCYVHRGVWGPSFVLRNIAGYEALLIQPSRNPNPPFLNPPFFQSFLSIAAFNSCFFLCWVCRWSRIEARFSCLQTSIAWKIGARNRILETLPWKSWESRQIRFRGAYLRW